MIKNNKVLVIQGDNELLPSPNEICTEKIINQMYIEGYIISKITYRNLKNQNYFEKVYNANIYRVNPRFSVSMILSKNKKKSISNLIISKLGNIISHFEGAIFGLLWPLLDPIAVLKMFNQADKIYKETSIDFCIVVYKQIESVLAGLMLKKKYPNIKLVLYLLDSMSGSSIPRVLRSYKIAYSSIKRWERLSFEIADSIFIMEAHEEYYSCPMFEKYSHKFHKVDIPLLDDTRYKNEKKDTNKKIFNLVYTGSMSLNTANPHYLVQILKKISNEEVKFHIYGNISKEVMNILIESNLLNKSIFYYGKLPHHEILKIQSEADILVNFGNSNSCMIPSKIFEYISTGNKILNFSYSSNDSSVRYLEKYYNSLIIWENKNFENNLHKFCDFLSVDYKNENNTNENIKEIFYKNSPMYFIKELEKL